MSAIAAPTMTSSVDVHHVFEQVTKPFTADLEAVTRCMRGALNDPVAERAIRVITAGGKRLRPVLVLLAGTVGGAANRQALIETAAAIELIHTATLIHDDIIDRAPFRRSQPTLHAQWGTERAVLMGDYLYATAFAVLTKLREPCVTQIIATVCQQLCRGELREVEARYRLDISEAEYLEIIHDKTASLMRGCCQSGGYVGGASDEVREHLATFGTNIGLAFQIVDDCLDWMGETQTLGKSIHADLDKGTLSLPIIYLSQMVSPDERERLFAPLASHQDADPEFLTRVAQAAQSSGALARARARATEFVQLAQASLAQMPLNGVSELFDQLAQYALLRTR